MQVAYFLVLVDGGVNSRPDTLRLAVADAAYCLKSAPSSVVRISPVYVAGGVS